MKYTGLILMVVLGAFIGALVQSQCDQKRTRLLAIEHRCGGYVHDTGDFAWENAAVPPIPSSALNDLGKGHSPTKAEAEEVKKVLHGK